MDVANLRMNVVVHAKCDRYYQFVKFSDNGRLTVVQKVKVVLFYSETKSLVATQRGFRAHFVTNCAPCKQTIYRLSLEKLSSLWGLILYQMSNAFLKLTCVMCTINGMSFREPLCISRCISLYEVCWYVPSPTRKEKLFRDQTRNLMNIFPKTFNTYHSQVI